MLVITKASLKMNWWRELTKWLVRPELRDSVGIAEGKTFPTTRVVIMNYDIAHNFRRSIQRDWDCVIIDEAHLLANPKTRRAKSIIGYKPKKSESPALADSGIPAKYRLALTGTPIENNLQELWTVLWWLDREKFPSKWRLLKMAGCQYVPGSGSTGPSGEGLDRLQRFLRENVMVRRLKSEVLKELPPKTRTITEFPRDGFEDLIREERSLWDASEDERTAAQAEAELAKAADDEEGYKQAVAKLRHVGGIAFNEMASVRKATAVRKVPLVIEQIRVRLDEVKKVLVFAHHHEVLEFIHAAFPGESVMVYGKHDQSDRDRSVQRFMKDPACRIFAGSIRACGEGLNLTAATHVMFAESDWTPSKMAQAEDRAHRIGQRDNVTVEVCVVDGTIDAQMVKTCVEKADFADKALDVALRERAVCEEVVDAVPKWKPLARREDFENVVDVAEPDREAIHRGLGMLAGMCDGARKLDGAGFNKVDAIIGRQLASLPFLSPRQTILGAKLVQRYKRQLGDDAEKVANAILEQRTGK